VRYLLLDCLGVSRVGATLAWTRAMTECAGRFAGSGKAPIAGTWLEVAPSIAALINGTAAHGYELDDTHDASMSHPGAVVIPAATAVAAEIGASADELIAAIASGYEAMTGWAWRRMPTRCSKTATIRRPRSGGLALPQQPQASCISTSMASRERGAMCCHWRADRCSSRASPRGRPASALMRAMRGGTVWRAPHRVHG